MPQRGQEREHGVRATEQRVLWKGSVRFARMLGRKKTILAVWMLECAEVRFWYLTILSDEYNL